MSTPVNTSSTDSQMHNNIMAAGSKERPPMLGPGRYSQWRSRFLRYLDTKSNGEYLRKCIFEGPYTPTSVLIAAVEAAENIQPVAAHEEAETIHNMTTENKLYFQAEKEAIFSIMKQQELKLIWCLLRWMRLLLLLVFFSRLVVRLEVVVRFVVVMVVELVVVHFGDIVTGFVDVVEIDVEVVVVRIVVEEIVLVSYLAYYIGYQLEQKGRDIVRMRLNVEMKVLQDLKTMMSLEASRG
ncbi:hypothetical protein Tco_0276722 [Tanacetum coccineum]